MKFAYAILIAIFLINQAGRCWPSESPQRDLYVLDYRDDLFNHMSDPGSMQSYREMKKHKQCDGIRLILEANAYQKRMDRMK